MRFRSSAILALVTVSLLGPAAHAQLDAITGSRGTPTLGTIVEMSPSEVSIETRDGKKTFAVNEIQKLNYGDDPRDLRRARESLLKEQYEAAKTDLANLSTDGITRREILQDIEFYKGFCEGKLALTTGGDKVAAVKMLRAFIENPANQGNYHYFDAVRILGDLAVALESNDAALKYYEDLARAPWPGYKMAAAVLIAGSMVADGDHAGALQRYQSVIDFEVDTPEGNKQKLLATIGKAVCLAHTGKPDEGIKLIQGVIANNDSSQNAALFGRAYNALGNCHLQAGKPQEALLAFLHVDLLFYTEPEIHAEALYYLSDLWRQVNKSDRAIRARSLLQSRYAGSTWEKKKRT